MNRLSIAISCLFFSTHLFTQTDASSLLLEINPQWEHQADVHAEFFSDLNLDNFDEVELVQFHLSNVEKVLRLRPVDHLSEDQINHRLAMLDELRAYWKAGVFPQNIYHEQRTPYFIDHLGTHCAVGQLVKVSGYANVAQDIAQSNNYIKVHDIKDERLSTWANTYGFEVDELAWIQPQYGGEVCEDAHEAFVGEFRSSGDGSIDQVEILYYYPSCICPELQGLQVEILNAQGEVYHTRTYDLAESCDYLQVHTFITMAVDNILQDPHFAIALSVDYGDVFGLTQFVSHGGEITAVEGEAVGLTSTDVGVVMQSSTSADSSIARVGEICSQVIEYQMIDNSDCSFDALTFVTTSFLPVQLTSFDVGAVPSGVEVQWETTSELDNMGFYVERSMDGVAFQPIAFVESKNGSGIGSQYAHVDHEVQEGQHYFYRLVQQDLDGTQQIHGVKSIKIEAQSVEITIFPNPVSGDLLNVIGGGLNDGTTYQIFDIAGKVLSEGIISQQGIPINTLGQGTYLLALQEENKRETKRFVRY